MSRQTVPDFPTGLDWFNSPPLSMEKELKGKLVVLDFWTYCCINCLHILPDLAELEELYKGAPVAFVGVHSAKFANEKVSENIRQAILRYEIAHPVVNDHEMVMWKALGVRSWPTIAIISPDGTLLATFAGEGHKQEINQFITASLNHFDDELFNNTPLLLAPEQEAISPLCFPGKIATDETGERLFVSDTNHNRIVTLTPEGEIIGVIGSGEASLRDGNFTDARFDHPQGLAYAHGHLYVADTENHALRSIDLDNERVTTLAGTGEQGYDRQGGRHGTDQPLSSPWDVAVFGDKLLIAMAGTHQIWIHNVESGESYAFSGSGAELHLNSNDLGQAGWAQPSGLALEGTTLYVADSESSAIRALNLKDLSTYTLVGGDPLAPQNLFSFGDSEGQGGMAKLQHPLGLAYLPDTKEVIVADTYNHKLKLLDPKNQTIRNWIGTGKPGVQDGSTTEASFYEPSGVAATPDGTTLYVTDTNNHLIRKVDVASGVVSTLNLSHLPRPVTGKTVSDLPLVDPDLAQRIVSDPIAIHPGADGQLILHFTLPEGRHNANGGMSQWRVIDADSLVWHVPPAYRAGVIHDEMEATIPFMAGEEKGIAQVEVLLYTCREGEACHLDQFIFEIPFVAGDEEDIEIHVTGEATCNGTDKTE